VSDVTPRDQAARDAALDTELSVIVQAPAGSGKTGLLVQRFLGLLAEVSQPEEIVAITFTRKAAAEMHERILSAMHSVDETNDASEPANVSANAKGTRELARNALEANARHGWGLLENPARLRVTTIDAFNTLLTRQLPLRSGFGQSPAITEQSADLCRAAARRLLQGMDRGNEAGNALGVLLEHLDNRPGDLAELLAGMLAKRDLWQRHLEFGGLDRAALEAALAREVESILRVLSAEFPLHLHAAISGIAKRCADYLERSARAGDNEWLMDIATWTDSPAPRAADLPRWQLLTRLLLTGAGELRKPKGLNATFGFPAASEKGIGAEEKVSRDAHKAAMCEVLATLEGSAATALLERVLQLPAATYTDAQWRVLDALNTLMPHAVLALQETFRDQGEVDFPELSIRARTALGSDEQPTDLALRLDHRIRHLLVDEFQDTSHSQIDLLLRLTRDWQPGDGRTLFLVGDPMQSIYQFREAEVGHFLVVRDSGLGALDLQSLRLSANFRSQQGVVDWVNGAFREIFPFHDDIATGAVAFEPSEAVLPPLDAPAVEVHAFGQHENDVEAQRVLELLRTAIADDDNESTAILVRGRAHLAGILPLLREHSIAFRAVELDSLESVPLVQDLLALARTLVNPADTTAFLSVLRAPWCGLTLVDLHALIDSDIAPHLCLHSDVAFARLSTDGRARILKMTNVLRDAENARSRMPLHERVAVTWHALGGPATLQEPEDLDNAQLFFELLQQMEAASDLADVNELDQRLKKLFAAPDPHAGSAVQIMTLHKAKGLQFDTVIIPALDQITGRKDRLLFHWIERPQPGGGEHVLLGPVKSREDEEGGAIYRFIERLKDEKEALERARLLYVGITRAKRHVHLLGKARYSSSGGAIALAPPKSGSLLELLWPLPQVRAAFDALPLPVEKPLRPERGIGATTLRRLPADWTPPLASGVPFNVTTQAAAGEAGRPVYEWAGDRVRHVGTLVHRVLERIANDGLQAWNLARIQTLPIERQLAALGLPETECAPAAADVRNILERVLISQHAAWILDAHAHARNEWALGGMDRGERVNVSLDRSFVDGDGVRWIIDYKTSAHEGSDMDGFLAQQQERYRGQLERYARLVHTLEGRPVKVALYFPLQDALRAWTPELD